MDRLRVALADPFAPGAADVIEAGDVDGLGVQFEDGLGSLICWYGSAIKHGVGAGRTRRAS